MKVTWEYVIILLQKQYEEYIKLKYTSVNVYLSFDKASFD